jgi:hypothetical protein
MNNGGTYHVIFDQSNTVEVDAVLDNLDGSLASLGDWTNLHTHYRYHTNKEKHIIGSAPRPSANSTASDFWTSHLAEFQMQGIPVEMYTSIMLHPPKVKRAPWVKYTYSDMLSNNNKHGAPCVIPGQSDYAQKSKSTAGTVTVATESN